MDRDRRPAGRRRRRSHGLRHADHHRQHRRPARRPGPRSIGVRKGCNARLVDPAPAMSGTASDAVPGAKAPAAAARCCDQRARRQARPDRRGRGAGRDADAGHADRLGYQGGRPVQPVADAMPRIAQRRRRRRRPRHQSGRRAGLSARRPAGGARIRSSSSPATAPKASTRRFAHVPVLQKPIEPQMLEGASPATATAPRAPWRRRRGGRLHSAAWHVRRPKAPSARSAS